MARAKAKVNSEKMTEDQLAGIIKGHLEDGLGSDLGDISTGREEIFDRYMGEMYGNERDGESQVTTRDIFETIEWALPPLLRHFTSGGRPVEFEAEDEQDELAAEQETEAVQQQFWKDNNGFTILYLIFKTTMMNPNGYIKVCRDDGVRTVFETYRGMDLGDVAMINDDDELELIEAEESEDDPGIYTVKIKRELKRGKNLVLVLPEDEVVVDGDWPDLDLDDCPFVCHYPEKTQSELIQMDYDEDELDEVYSAGGEAYNSEETNRRTTSDETYSDDETHKALRKFRYHECQMLVDFDGDGIAERRRVVMIGDKIFENELTDEQPIIAASTILMPHKHVGMSMGEIVLDLQEIRTTVWRQLLTNMYRMNNPRTIALKGANISDIISNRSNGVIRAKSPGDVTIEDTKPIIGQVIPLLQLIDETKDMRTGITKQSTVPDPKTLQASGQESYLSFVEKADQRIDLLARIFAETIVKRMYIKLHALILKHGDTKQMKTNGQWIRVDPTSWRRRESMTIHVGLGVTSKHQKLAAAQIIKADHDMLIDKGAIADPQAGKPGLITLQHVYNGRKLLVESLGELGVDKYYQNPQQIQQKPQPQQPDINMLMIQSNERIEGGKRQNEVMKMRSEAQMKMITGQKEYALQERKFRFEEIEAQYEQRIEAAELKLKNDAANDKLEIEMHKNELEALKAKLDDAQKDEALSVQKFEAQLAADTQIMLKMMDLGQDPGPIVTEMVRAREGIAASQDSVQGTQTQMLESFQSLASQIDQNTAADRQVNAESQDITNQRLAAANEALGRMASVIDELRQPKQIEYDLNGEIVGVKNPNTGQVRPLVRDEEGKPVGLA